jgi:uncharacterized protein (TIGR02594 family)
MTRFAKKLSAVSSEPMWLQCARQESLNLKTSEYEKALLLKATVDPVASSAAFVGWCLEICGIMSTRSAIARSYLSWGKKSEPRIGAVAVFQNGTHPWQGHVGFVVSIEKDFIGCLGHKFPKSKVLGFRWPA